MRATDNIGESVKEPITDAKNATRRSVRWSFERLQIGAVGALYEMADHPLHRSTFSAACRPTVRNTGD
jgi:hypothetical protein